MADERTEASAAGAAAPTVLERIFEDGRLVRDEHQVDSARRMLQGFVEEATKAGVQLDGSAKRALATRIVALDKLISEQVNQVLHDEKFQRLEASWRNLDKLVDENDLTSSKVRVFNCHRAEIERDFRRAPGFDQSVFFKHVYESEYGTLGGSPYTFLVGDMEFGRSPMDIQFLKDISAVASMAHAPFLASADPNLLDLDSFTELDRPIDIAKIFDTSEMASWNALRESADARYLALTAPRTLVRLPWGPDTAPVEAMDFVEDVDGEDHGKYLWGPASWALAGQIMKSFSEYGWPSAIRGTESGGKVANLPLHAFPSLSGAKITKCPTETTITDRREKELSDEGVIALCHARNTDYAVIFSGSTVNRPQKYVEEEANANARLSASLPYILACARFAHYLKAIMRDKIGGFTSRDEVQRYLSTWISQYVTSDDSASHATKARYPLREARIEVQDVPGKPGAYTAVAHLRPHFQLEELTASLRLVAELPT
ncbi:MAG: type VI secretion system contractile sheath large subunit [Gammaproteobacteria bacterium]|nr:type VI secretion system contractile sheath large subunit [Gammaproteobacteria bacterium]